MSLIIKGMEMPQAGDVIICGQIDGKLQCTIVTRGKPIKWCEASEVSAPHGRLIDADELTRWIERAYGDKDIVKLVTNDIKRQSTIIEAEVSE